LTPEPFLDGAQLRRLVRRLASEISADHPDGVVLVTVLKGGLLFASDLLRALSVPAEVDFLAISAYEPGSGRVRLVKDLDGDIGGRHVVLVEDVVDTGLTLAYLMGELRRREPASLEVCALLDKQARRLVPTPIRYRGSGAPDRFLLGYGLDFAGRYRNLDLVALGDAELLARDPDTYVGALYGASR
jgi:hypoxanthine phosphoribosyltransferase